MLPISTHLIFFCPPLFFFFFDGLASEHRASLIAGPQASMLILGPLPQWACLTTALHTSLAVVAFQLFFCLMQFHLYNRSIEHMHFGFFRCCQLLLFPRKKTSFTLMPHVQIFDKSSTIFHKFFYFLISGIVYFYFSRSGSTKISHFSPFLHRQSFYMGTSSLQKSYRISSS